MNRKFITAGLAAVALTLAGCGSPAPEQGGNEPTPSATGSTTEPEGTDTPEAEASVVRVVTHDSFDLPEELLTQFTAETGYELEFSAPGDAGALVNQLILTKDSPLGDVVFGIDNSFAARAANSGILEEYAASGLPASAEGYAEAALTPIDMGDVCLNIDDEWFQAEGITPPETFDDLLDEDYRGLTVLTNPAQSSPGLAFLLATISNYGDTWTDYWSDLLANDTSVVDGWSAAYYTDFTANGGSRPIALSYATSPAFTLTDDGGSSTSALLDTCFRQIEYAGVLTGADNPAGARAFIDFLLSPEVQAEIPEAMFMYPVLDVDLPSDWAAHAPIAENPHNLTPEEIEANLNDWLRTWQDDVIG